MLLLLLSIILICFPIYNIHQQLGSKLPNFNDTLRDLQWGNVNFLHTTDTHSWYLGHLNQKQYSADWGDYISFTRHLRDIASIDKVDLIVVDTGDKHDGNGLGDVTSLNGNYSSRIFAQQDFDLLTIGNHELYVESITEHEYTEVVPLFGDKYVCTNVEYIDPNGDLVPFGAKYHVFETKNQHLKILGLGILFNFERKNSKAKVTPILELIKQQWFQKLLEDAKSWHLDMVLVIGHIPVSHEWAEFQILHNFIRSYFPDTVIQYFGGHSHIRDFVQLDDRSFGLQSGRYCETVGWFSIKDLTLPKLVVDRKYLDFNVHSFMHHSKKSSDDFNTLKGLQTSQQLSSMAEELSLNQIYGNVPHNYLVNAAPINDENNLLHFLKTDILTRLVPKTKTALSNSRIIIINTGSIRYDLYKGAFTKNSRYIVSPFKNKWNFISRVPRHVALAIEPILNNQSYVISELEKVKLNQAKPMMLNLLKPETKYSLKPDTQHKLNYFEYQRSYGYVTNDDFGSNGDDTVHKPFPYYQEPNVIQSVEGSGEYVDVVYYDFIEPHIIFALNELGYTPEMTYIYNDLNEEFNVGQLLQDYIQENWN